MKLIAIILVVGYVFTLIGFVGLIRGLVRSKKR